jgi:DNA repair ATPase RecN
MSNEITEEKYRKLKQQVEETKAEADRAQGALDQLLSRLKEEFDCSSLKEAKAKLAELESKKKKAESVFEKVLADYEEKWKQ